MSTFVWVDDGKRFGGGQLSLLRYLRSSSLVPRTEVISLMEGKFSESMRRSKSSIRVLGWDGGLPLALRTMLRLREIARRLSLRDVVVANSLTAAILIRFAFFGTGQKPILLYYMHEALTVETLHGLKRLVVLRAILPFYDGFIVNSRWTASVIPKSLSSTSYRVCYPVSGIEPAQRRSRTEVDSSGNDFEFVTLSRLTHWKGIDLALEALEILIESLHDRDTASGDLPAVTLKIAGVGMPDDDQYVKSLHSYAERNHLPVQFLGHVDDVPLLLATAGALLLPSRQPEPYGQVVAQGLAAGTIVVASAAGGPLEMISSHVNGLLFTLGDAQSLAEQMLALVTMTDNDRRRIRASAVESALKYQDTTTAQAVDETLLSSDRWTSEQGGNRQ